MEYQYNNNNNNVNDVIVISNKEKDKYYQNIYNHNNSSILKKKSDVLQSKIIDLNNRIDFIKKNCFNYDNSEINLKLQSTIDNIDSIIEQINCDIINKAQINDSKKIIFNNF
jgi:hypothetical protein